MIFVYFGLLLLLYFLYRRNNKYWESRGVPFEKPFLFFGSFYNVVKGKEPVLYTIRSIYNKYQTPYVGIHTFTQPNLVIRSPELIKKILVKDFDKFANRKFASNESVDPLAFHSLFSAKDSTWRSIRSKLSPVFTSGKMKLMLPLIKDCTEDLVAYLTKCNGSIVDVRNVTKKYTVDVISSCAFGINSNCLKKEDSDIMEAATKLIDQNSFIRNISVFCYFFMPKLVDIFRLTFTDKRYAYYLVNIFKETLRQREEKKIVRNDLIDLLNNLKKSETSQDGYKFDDIKMAAQAIVFFGGGNDTTSQTITYTLYELAINKNVQNLLRQEVLKTFKETGAFTYENIQEMKYLDMVVSETLRKYPLTSFLNRESTSRYTFEETGFTLDKGVSVIIPVSGLHFDEEYFPNPENFDPERFRDKSKIKPYTYLPFGEGPRICIGQRFGLLVAKTALAFMIKDFMFEPTRTTSIPLEFDPGTLFLESKNGVHLNVVRI